LNKKDCFKRKSFVFCKPTSYPQNTHRRRQKIAVFFAEFLLGNFQQCSYNTLINKNKKAGEKYEKNWFLCG